jgi:hypothetical protein
VPRKYIGLALLAQFLADCHIIHPVAMDFLDPEKQKKHAIRIAIGYALIGLTLLLATVILLYRAYGFGIDKEGRVIQNGLVFVSSRPTGGDLYVNSKKHKDQTNTRMSLPSGQYVMEVKRNGYHSWKRVMTVEGGSVSRFDYPFLFPVSLSSTVTKQYDAAPGLATESPDRRWLLVGVADQNSFDLFDLDARQPTAKTVAMPTEILAAGSNTKGWELVEWSANNRHAVLKRAYERSGQTAVEYVLFDRQDPALSQNLSVLLGFTPTTLELRGGAYDQYYLHDQNNGELFTATIKKPTPQPLISNVAAFTAERDMVLYVTTTDAPTGKALVRMQKNDEVPVTLRQVPANTPYLLDMATYDGAPHVAIGAQVENRVHVYRDPMRALNDDPTVPLVPLQILKVAAPSHVSFSANKRFVVAESGDRFAVYDAETDRGYAYQINMPLDMPQLHATWMDGFRLSYTSGGKLIVFDYDGTNMQTLTPVNPAFVPFFDRDYRSLYSISPTNALSATPLLTREDQ